MPRLLCLNFFWIVFYFTADYNSLDCITAVLHTLANEQHFKASLAKFISRHDNVKEAPDVIVMKLYL